MPTVLVVTDDREVRGILAGMLAEQGTTVVEVDDAVEAIARIGGMDKRPDLVLVDRRLARGKEVELLDCRGGGSGRELARRVRPGAAARDRAGHLQMSSENRCSIW